jgi:hypothetical protein
MSKRVVLFLVKGSWQFIKKERNSLNRYSNMGLIVEE